MDYVDVKYFKLSVGTIKKETPDDISTNCPVCKDTKGRLHVYQKSDMEQPLIRCFNSGCDLEQHQGMVRFLSFVSPSLVDSYKKEKFNKNIKNISSTNSIDLNDILGNLRKVHVDKINVSLESKEDLVLPKLFIDLLIKVQDSKEALKYLENRNIVPQDDWMFSRNKFITIFEKNYFVEDFIFIPLWQNYKLRGFYTRSIKVKQFSTIIFPKGEKYWISKNFNTKERCYVFEGIFDALSSGFTNTCAMLSADLPQDFLESLEDPVFCLDNDETGISKSLKYCNLGYNVFIWPQIEVKDMNKLLETQTLEDNKNMIQGNIFKGINAKVRLNISKF